MRYVVQQLGDVPGEVGVPGVRVDQVDPLTGGHHRQVGRHGLQRGVGGGEARVGLAEGQRVGPLVAHAENGQVDAVAQLTGEVVDMDAGAAVDGRRIFASEQADAHASYLSVNARRGAADRVTQTAT